MLGVIDNLLDLSGPANAAIRDLYGAYSRLLIADIKAINPAWYYASLTPGGPVTPEGMANDLTYLRMERAAQLYNRTGDASLLQLETLRTTQRFVDEGYTLAVQRYESGRLSPRLNREEAIGNYMDRYVREHLTQWYNQYGISYAAGRPVGINNRAYASDGSYRIPDARVGNVAFDWTVSWKSASTSQVGGFFNASFRPNAVVIVRPAQLGGSYIIPRQGQRR